MGYGDSIAQQKNLCWMLPRPDTSLYPGGMPLHAEKWLIDLASDLLGTPDPDVMQVFCGMTKRGFRVDIRPDVNPDLCCDVHRLSDHLSPDRQFDVIIADPPFSNKEARTIFGTPRLNYKRWTSECDKFLRPGGLFIVYHKVMVANPDPTQYVVEKRVTILNRVWHQPRVVMIFRKHGGVQCD